MSRAADIQTTSGCGATYPGPQEHLPQSVPQLGDLRLRAALLIAGLALSTVFIVQGASTSLRRAADRLGADIVVVPQGTESKVEMALLSDVDRSRLRNEQVGFVFQFPSLLPTLTTLENVVLPATFGTVRAKDPALRARARELLTLVGLDDKLTAYPRELSAGQQQRVVLARSMVNQPRLFLADEPSTNLDERTEAEIMQRFGELHDSTGITILMVTHTSQLKAYDTRAIEMSAGRILAGD